MTFPHKIALVMISNFGRADGGRETWAYQFLPRLLARNRSLDLDVYGLRVDGQPENEAELRSAVAPADRPRLSVTFFRAPRNRIPNAAYMVREMRKFRWPRERPVLALGVGSFVELLCMQLAPGLRGVPKAVWLRTIFVDEKAHRIPEWLRPLALRLETAVLRRAKLIIANGDDTAAHYRARGLAVEVIKNAVDLDRWRMPPPSFDAPIDIAFIGRLTAVKGAAEFLELCRRLTAPPGPCPFRFHVIGEGEYSAEAEELAAEGRLRHHGVVPNEALPSILQEIDVCVALGFVGATGARGGGSGVSNAVLEQMAAGRLLIAWDNAAYRQVIDDGCGYLVAQGDIDALADVLNGIVSDPSSAVRRCAGAASRARMFGFDSHMAKFESAAKAVQLSSSALV